MPILFALVGATAVGKTQQSLALAQKYNAEIICLDSRQIYREFSIGTAQATKAELQMVPHHLVGFLDPLQLFSAGEFIKKVQALLQENPEQNYILVGGTGLYLRSLSLGLAPIPSIDPFIREEIQNQLQNKGIEALYQKAMQEDPIATQKITPQDTHRILRILEVKQQTGQKLSELQNNREGGHGEILTFYLHRPREELYHRIHQRIDHMLQNGWPEEVSQLSQIYPLHAPAWQSLGYRELLSVQNQKTTLKHAIEHIQKSTRHYAKRQITWFKHQCPHIPLDLSTLSNQQIQEQIHHQLQAKLTTN